MTFDMMLDITFGITNTFTEFFTFLTQVSLTFNIASVYYVILIFHLGNIIIPLFMYIYIYIILYIYNTLKYKSKSTRLSYYKVQLTNEMCNTHVICNHYGCFVLPFEHIHHHCFCFANRIHF